MHNRNMQTGAKNKQEYMECEIASRVNKKNQSCTGSWSQFIINEHMQSMKSGIVKVNGMS